MEYKDYYKILGVPRGATQDGIKRAYRRLARKYHPDVSNEPEAEARIKEVNEAYEVLKDPQKRQAYDQLGSGWQAGQDFKPPPNWNTTFNFGGVGFSVGGSSGFSDFFESLFGRAAGRASRKTGSGRRGTDERASINISLEDAYRGSVQTIHLQVSETSRSGVVAKHNRALRVRIPAGVTHGQEIRLSGQGECVADDAQSGDLYLRVDIQQHRLYRLEHRDVYVDLPVAPWEAALGAKVSVPTLGGQVDLKIPAGSQSGRKLRLKGRGLPGRPAGDQYVVVQIVTPPADTETARSFYQKMAREMPFDPRAKMST